MVLSLCVMSCGKKDTAASLSDEMVAQMEELVSVIESAKDKESAEKAATRIGEIGDEMVAIAGRLDALGDPSEEDQKLVKDKMDAAEKANQDKMMAIMKNVMSNQEVAAILGKAMEEFGKKMEGAEDTFKKYGKD